MLSKTVKVSQSVIKRQITEQISWWYNYYFKLFSKTFNRILQVVSLYKVLKNRFYY